jgi:hypothetical protein
MNWVIPTSIDKSYTSQKQCRLGVSDWQSDNKK